MRAVVRLRESQDGWTQWQTVSLTDNSPTANQFPFRDVVAKDRYIECVVVQFGEEFAQVIYRLQTYFCNDNGPIDSA